MYYHLRPLICWPDRDALMKTLPMDFSEHCPRCAVIIDCFEKFFRKTIKIVVKSSNIFSL